MIKTLLTICLSITTLTRLFTNQQFSLVSAEATQSPFRSRVSLKLIKKIFNMRDQEVFKLFKDVRKSDKLSTIADLQFSILPKDEIQFDDFDFQLKVSKEYFGAESSDVQVVGTAKLLSGEEVKFKAPVSLIKLRYELGEKYNHELKFLAQNFFEKEWIFDFQPSLIQEVNQGETPLLSDEMKKEIGQAVTEYVSNFKDKFTSGSKKKDGDYMYVDDFPMDTVIPLACLYYATHFSDSFEVTDDFVTLGFSLQKFNLLSDKQKQLLKPITGDFDKDQDENGFDAFVQFQIDDNLFNSFSAVISSVEKTFSARDFMKSNPKTSPFLNVLTTTTVGAVLPQFIDNYGKDKKIDLLFSPSHNLFLDGFPNSKMTGVYIDKNGNWKIQANIVVLVNVETTPGRWESVRSIYMTIVFKLKVRQELDETEEEGKRIIISPKSIEISQIKVMKGEEEESMEQMMIQSMANIQFEALRKMFIDYPIKIGDLLSKNPKELQCLGFNVADVDVSFKKSQVQFSAFYKEMENHDKDLCESFMKELRQSPKKIQEQYEASKESPVYKQMKEQLEGRQQDLGFDSQTAQKPKAQFISEEL